MDTEASSRPSDGGTVVDDDKWWTPSNATRWFASSSSSSARGGWWFGLALAQACALVNATSAAASTALERSGVALPSWQTFFAYLLLACAFAPRYGKRVARAERGAVGYDWQKARKYALCALVDVEANYCVTLAFKYTSMTSVSLLDSATIPFAMVLSKALLGSVYARGHVVGALVAFAGLTILVLGDATPVNGNENVRGTNPALGDFLAILAAALYATSNVLVEAFLRDADKVEILAHLGAFGVVMSGVQSAILEGMKFSQLRALGAKGFGFFALYAGSLFTMYTFAMDVLENCGASAFNVSMLASDIWSVVLRLLFFNGFATVGAFVAFAFSFCFVGAGICVFAYAGDPKPSDEGQPSSASNDAGEPSLWRRLKRVFLSDGTPRRYVSMDDDANLALDTVELAPVPSSR